MHADIVIGRGLLPLCRTYYRTLRQGPFRMTRGGEITVKKNIIVKLSAFFWRSAMGHNRRYSHSFGGCSSICVFSIPGILPEG